MLEHLRKLIKALLRQGAQAIVRSPLAARLGLLQSLRLTHRFLAHVAVATPAAIEPEKIQRPSSRLPRLIWFIADVQWEKHELIPELKKIGEIDVTDLSPAIDGGICREQIVRLVESESATIQPDLIVLYAREGLLSAELFELLRQKNVLIWGLNLDDKTEFFKDEGLPYGGRYGYSRWASFFDLNLSSSRTMVEQYRLLGAKARYFPEGFHLRPEFQEIPSIQYPLSFVGANREDRRELIRTVREYGFKLSLFGAGWPGGQMAETPWRVYRASQLNLGIGFASPSRVTALKARDFECPGARGCYLTTYNWELCEHFDIGREILCYRSVEELVEMLAYYLKRPDECAAIALAGSKRAEAQHTWEARFREIFKLEF